LQEEKKKDRGAWLHEEEEDPGLSLMDPGDRNVLLTFDLYVKSDVMEIRHLKLNSFLIKDGERETQRQRARDREREREREREAES